MLIHRSLSLIVLISLLCMPAYAAESGSRKDSLRCGWFDNPSPSNVWFKDRDGEWTIGMQGGYQAAGNWPRFRAHQWVRTNGSYGYGCACLRVVADPESHAITHILGARAVPLQQCRRDRALKEPI